ncbi:hypothetical protein [Polycladomyces abyssicola]|uniref:hypothetical protein n=1 Tax=Polycladomyces abyssicola TaxID=1125966 RepID=UPI001BB2D543|nr:hypothetical protein [Polycladomyces abyssicola]
MTTSSRNDGGKPGWCKSSWSKRGIRAEVGGGEKDIQEGLISLGTSIVVAIGLVFISLTLTYRGLLTPMIICLRSCSFRSARWRACFSPVTRSP